MEKKAKVIAVCGKGGVGKTSISALIVKVLREQKGKRILAIDADPAIGLSGALGVEVTKTVDTIRTNVIEAARHGQKDDKLSMLKQLDYEVFEAITEKDGFAFLAIGRPETEGCYCKVNSYLKEIIEGLTAQFDYVVIDGEAGIEQINRRVMNEMTHLLMVSDASFKGINVIKTIRGVAEKVVKYDRAGLILNRLKHADETAMIHMNGIELLGVMNEDEQLRRHDIKGLPILELPEGPSASAVREVLKSFGVYDQAALPEHAKGVH